MPPDPLDTLDTEDGGLPCLSKPNESQPTYYRHNHGKNRDYIISNRDFYVLSLHLAGYSAQEIAELAGYASPYTVYTILKKREVLMVRQQLLDGLELEFETLQQDVFRTITDKIHSEDEHIQLEAIQIWMRYFNKYKEKGQQKEEVTAEDVVRKMLQVNVQVNVGEKRED